VAHKKGGGSSRNGRDSNAQRRGVKKYGGERVTAGNILVRQRVERSSILGRTSEWAVTTPYLPKLTAT